MTTLKKGEIKGCITEVKSLASPPVGVIDTLDAVMTLLGYQRPAAPQKPFSAPNGWMQTKKFLAQPSFLDDVLALESKNVTKEQAECAKEKLSPYCYDSLKKKSAAAAFFFKWAIDHVNAVVPPASS